MPTFHCVSPTLKTENLRRTVEFYCDRLGFTVDTLWPEEEPTFCILDRGGVHLMFYEDRERRESAPSMTGQLRIDMDDLMTLYEAVKNHVRTEWGPEVYHYGRREVSIKDCNGYSLVLSEATTDPPTCLDD